jgi:uncharacterized protein (TIGR02246 family)
MILRMSTVTSTAAPDVAAAIRALDASFTKNLRAGDATQMVDAFYWPDAKLLPPGMPMIEGRDALIGFWEGFLGETGATDGVLNTTDIEVQGDMACTVGTYDIRMGDGSSAAGKYVVVFRRRNGEWKAAVDIFSANS